MKKISFNILRALIAISFGIMLITSILAKETLYFPADEGYVKGTTSGKTCLIVIQPTASLKEQTADSLSVELFNQGLETEDRIFTARGEDLIGVVEFSEIIYEIRMSEPLGEDAASTICVKIKKDANTIIEEFSSEGTIQNDENKIIAQGEGYLVECNKE